MKTYPAFDVRTDSADLLLALVDDFSPTAVEERDAGVRVFFATAAARDEAAAASRARGFDASAIDVPDEDWARRSQEGLQPVTIGRIVVRTNPSPPISIATNPQSPIANPIAIVIPASMAFGTGHHATTRLCLEALQAIDIEGAEVLDVGTGSGILAIAAALLGAARGVGIDHDADAIQAARENLDRNPRARSVEFIESDLVTLRGRPFDLVAANLTGALLVRSAPRLLDLAAAGGHLILSGFLVDERDAIADAFRSATIVWERCEDEWAALAVKKS